MPHEVDVGFGLASQRTRTMRTMGIRDRLNQVVVARVRKFFRYFWSRKQIVDRDHVLLSTWEEWRKYKRFPAELLLHVGLLALVIIQVMMMTYQFTGYNRSNEDTFKRIFHPEEYRDGIYSIVDCLNVVNETVFKYFEFPYLSIDRFEVLKDDDNHVVPPLLTIVRFKKLSREFFNFSNIEKSIGSLGDFSTVESTYSLTRENPLGPMNSTLIPNSVTDDIHRLFYSLQRFTISFSFRNLDIGGLAPIPYVWTITQIYDLSQGGEIAFDISTDVRILRTRGLSAVDVFVVTAILIVILSCVSLTLGILSIQHSYTIYIKTKEKYEKYCQVADEHDRFQNWQAVPRKLKFFFFGVWPFYTIVMSFSLILSSFFGLFSQFGASLNEWFNILTGIGCLMLCIKLLRYLGYSKEFYSLSLTWATSFSRTINFLIIICPIFFGYTLFGMLNFAQYSTRFVDFDTTTITLYALLLGDDVRGAFVELEENSYPYPFVPKLYLYTFVTFFITSVLNVFIFIIEDSYHVAKSGKLSSNPANRSAAKEFKDLSINDQLAYIFNTLDKWQSKIAADPQLRHLLDNPESDIELEELNQQINDPEVVVLRSASSTDLEVKSKKESLQSRIDAIIAKNHAQLTREVLDIQQKYAAILKEEILQLASEELD